MKSTREVHEKAMELAEAAFVTRVRGDLAQAEKLFRRAFELEAEAARLTPEEPAFALTRAVLHRSAATLASDCREYREAERLIGAGLAGNPPEAIAEELRELYEQVRVHLKRQVDEGDALESELETITGQLRYADDATNSYKRMIRLVDEQGRLRDIVVPPDRMPEIVGPLWGEMVTVTGIQRGHEILLEDIRPAVVT